MTGSIFCILFGVQVTGGWDSSIYLWDIEGGKVMDRFKNHHMGQELAFKACGGAILDMDFSPQKCVKETLLAMVVVVFVVVLSAIVVFAFVLL